jgi:ABC-type Fe3+-siderophore transport system permease subunit
MKVLGHLAKTLIRAFFRIFFTAILAAALAVGIGLLIAYEASHQWPPQRLVDVLVAVAAILFAYAAALTVLVSEAVKALLYTTKEAEKETYTAGNLIERGVKAAERVEHAEEAPR